MTVRCTVVDLLVHWRLVRGGDAPYVAMQIRKGRQQEGNGGAGPKAHGHAIADQGSRLLGRRLLFSRYIDRCQPAPRVSLDWDHAVDSKCL